MENKRPLQSISDDELIRRLAELLRDSRRVESELVAHIAEVDGRRLYAREASPSMFSYCTEVLHLSEAEAYLRITAARASREHPVLLSMLGDGRLHLSGIARLAPHLTRENAEGILKRAVHRSRRQIEELIAELFPKPDARAVMRKQPATREQAQPRHGAWEADAVGLDGTKNERGLSLGPSIELRPDRVASPELLNRLTTSEPATSMDGAVTNDPKRRPSPAPHPVVLPLSPARYSVRFTASADFHHKLERLRALMRTKVPDGDLAAIIEDAVTEKLERLEARRFATTKSPRKELSNTDTSASSRRIPAAVRRAVYERDGSRCRFVDEQGKRCTERHRLEYHHSHPFALGGDHSPSGIRLMCRTHNQYLAEQDYGKQAMEQYRRSGSLASHGAPTRSP